MTFTSTPPTTPGFYAWRAYPKVSPIAVVVFTDANGALWVNQGISCTLLSQVASGGGWCKLVPAEEISEAWSEGFQCGQQCGSEAGDFVNSRAKRVMEGLV